MKQRTLKKEYLFEGKGLHTGRLSHVCLKPGAEDSGIVFFRTDLGVAVPALAENVHSTRRSTVICSGKASVRTVEHILSAFMGLGVDNAVVELDNVEMPILDGSAAMYVDAILSDGLLEQNADRKWVKPCAPLEVSNPKTGSYIKITPADDFIVDLTIDFKSKVLGRQTVHWDSTGNYAVEVAPCRTFCFLREVLLLAFIGLARGGSVDNALVIVDKPVSPRRMACIARFLRRPRLAVSSEGYLGNVTLRFPDECARHKLLDLLGDLRLCGGFPKMRVEAYKPGHSINTDISKLIRKNR